MTKIKLCGARREEDIIYMNKYMPDYVGFVFAEKSKRKVTVEQAAGLSCLLRREIKRVGVFVSQDIGMIKEAVSLCGLDVIQLSGDEDPDYIRLIKEKLPSAEIWKAIRVGDEAPGKAILETMNLYGADKYLLDSYVEKSYGGNGVAFNWELVKDLFEGEKPFIENENRMDKIIIAGGLNPENVRNAIDMFRPYGVDVSSGIETEGVKDETKIREFIYKVRYGF